MIVVVACCLFLGIVDWCCRLLLLIAVRLNVVGPCGVIDSAVIAACMIEVCDCCGCLRLWLDVVVCGCCVLWLIEVAACVDPIVAD